jgi:hypothetical protein
MKAEVVFRLRGKEVARYTYDIAQPNDFKSNVKDAIDKFREEHPKTSLLDDGVSMLVQKVGQNIA